LPAIGATRFGRHTASSFIASKLGSYRCSPDPVGAVLARDKDGAILQAYRVIVHREQARLLQRSLYLLERGLPAIGATRFGRHTASSFIASKLGSYRDHCTCWSEACPRIRCRGSAGIPRHRSSRANSAPTEITVPVGARLARESVDAVSQTYRVIVLRGQASLQQVRRSSVGANLFARRCHWRRRSDVALGTQKTGRLSGRLD